MIRNRRVRHVPGEPGIWVLIFADLVVFGALFINYAWSRARASDGLPGLSGYDRALGCINTIVLLTSSWAVALAMVSARRGHAAAARRYILCALGLGALFVGIKVLEYSEKLSAGITPATSLFFTYFFTLTGLHLIHLLVGMAVLAWMWARMARLHSEREVLALESGASFWHMVDLLWIVIFPLLYLM